MKGSNHFELLEWLARQGADSKAEDKDGKTPEELAEKGFREFLSELRKELWPKPGPKPKPKPKPRPK